jgi:hypothetical protein
MKKFYSFIFIVFIGVIVFQWNSCKGPQPCVGVITVYDSAGVHPQVNVAVNLYAQINYNNQIYYGDLTVSGTTNSSGQFSVTIKDPCILDVKATLSKTVCDSNSAHPRNYCMGHALLTFAEGQTNNVSVYLNE